MIEGNKQIYFCAICNGPGSTRHHLIPTEALKRSKFFNKSNHQVMVRLCVKCHETINYYFSNWEMAVKYNTIEKLITELRIRQNYSAFK